MMRLGRLGCWPKARQNKTCRLLFNGRSNPVALSCVRGLERGQHRTGTETSKAEHGVSPPYPLFGVSARTKIGKHPKKPSPQPSPTGEGAVCRRTANCRINRITHKSSLHFPFKSAGCFLMRAALSVKPSKSRPPKPVSCKTWPDGGFGGNRRGLWHGSRPDKDRRLASVSVRQAG